MHIGKLLTILTVMMAFSAQAQENDKPLGAHWNWDPKAMTIIQNRCMSCHNRERIDQALNERKEMEKIQKSMEEKGAKLSEKEQEVLGLFWKKKPPKESSGLSGALHLGAFDPPAYQ